MSVLSLHHTKKHCRMETGNEARAHVYSLYTHTQLQSPLKRGKTVSHSLVCLSPEVSSDLLLYAACDGGHGSVPFGPHLCRDAVDDEALRPVGRLLQLTKPLSDQWLVVSPVGVNILGGGEGRGGEEMDELSSEEPYYSFQSSSVPTRNTCQNLQP